MMLLSPSLPFSFFRNRIEFRYTPRGHEAFLAERDRFRERFLNAFLSDIASLRVAFSLHSPSI